ncbi:MAG: hypothetical protein A2Z34_03690 [Planctomycetes bacterium RBG_16_59_8]|nr:MAG: hypothetical protein A2Z34_03690 [Planctomycetes bacterium RBG_16_59_8]
MFKISQKFADAFDDFWNPIVVKEMRQALRGRIFPIFFLIMVGVATVAFLMFVAKAESGYQSGRVSGIGKDIFVVLASILMLVSMVVVPLNGARRLAQERAQRSFELLQISTITPHKIVFGKITSCVIELILYFSAMTPFLVLSYMLGGVELPVVLFYIVLIFWGGVASCIIGVTLASYSSPLRMSQAPLALFGGVVIITSIGLIPAMVYSTERFDSSIFEQWEFWTTALSIAVGFVIAGGWATAIAKNPYKFPGANRSTEVRLWAFAMLVAYMVTACGNYLLYARSGYFDKMFFFVIAMSAYPFLFIHSLAFVKESDPLSQRVKRDIRVGRYRNLPFKFAFLPGGLRGFGWLILAILLLLIPFAGSLGWETSRSYSYGERTADLFVPLAIFGHILFWCAVPYLFFRRIFKIEGRDNLLVIVTVGWIVLIHILLGFVSIFTGSDHPMYWSGLFLYGESLDSFYRVGNLAGAILFLPIMVGLVLLAWIVSRLFLDSGEVRDLIRAGRRSLSGTTPDVAHRRSGNPPTE